MVGPHHDNHGLAVGVLDGAFRVVVRHCRREDTGFLRGRSLVRRSMASLVFLIVLALLSIPLWFRFVRQFPNVDAFRDSLPVPGKLGFVDVGLIFFMTQLIQLGGIYLGCGILGVPNSLANPEVEPTTGFRLIGVLSQLLACASSMAIICLRYREGVSIFGFRFERIRRDLKLGLLAFIMIIPGVLAIHSLISLLIPYQHETLSAMGKTDVYGILSLALGAVVAAPIYEEFFYRGAMLSWLLRFSYLAPRDLMAWVYGGPAGTYTGQPEDSKLEESTSISGRTLWSSVFFSAAMFGLMHAGQGGAPIALTLLAVALGYLFVRTGSLLPCIVVHFLLNAMTVIFSLLGS